MNARRGGARPARGLLANSAFALVGDVAAKAATALVMVIAARELSVAQFALLAFALAAAGILAAALDMGAQMLLMRDGVGSAEARWELTRALLLGRLPCVAALLLIAGGLGRAYGHVGLAELAVLYAALGAGQMLMTGALRSAQDLLPEASLKLLGGVLTIAACAAAVASGAANADGFLAAIGCALALTLLAGIAPTVRVLARGRRQSARGALRASLPLGIMTLATLLYYRSGTLGLTLLSTPAQTARFATASTVGFALLMAPNALTTGLLPKLGATSPDGHPALMRRAVCGAAVTCAAVAGVVALAAAPLLTTFFGSRYAAAAPALRILAASTALIGPTGVLGTVLVAQRRLRPVYVQVGASLVGNLIATAVFVPALGAVGAALATLVCEGVALLITARACMRAVPDLFVLPLRPLWRAAH